MKKFSTAEHVQNDGSSSAHVCANLHICIVELKHSRT